MLKIWSMFKGSIGCFSLFLMRLHLGLHAQHAPLGPGAYHAWKNWPTTSSEWSLSENPAGTDRPGWTFPLTKPRWLPNEWVALISLIPSRPLFGRLVSTWVFAVTASHLYSSTFQGQGMTSCWSSLVSLVPRDHSVDTTFWPIYNHQNNGETNIKRDSRDISESSQ